MEIDNQKTQTWTLLAETELRCEVDSTGEPLIIRLKDGNAEIFGIEIAIDKDYIFKDENVAVYTWYGCKIETSGGKEFYVTERTPMVAYANTHAQLEARRDVALANGVYGPRVLVVGPSDHGKSTTSRILTAYAARLDRTPFYVDLDVGQGSLSIPGCLCATPVEKTTMTAEDGFSLSTPLVYFHAHSTPRENVDLYKYLVSTLSSKVMARLDKDVDARASGIIINTCGWVDGEGYNLILHCIQEFNVDVVLVMDQDKLYSSLSSHLAAKGDNVTVVMLPRSGGVVTRDRDTRLRCRKGKFRDYFYGVSKSRNPLSPVRQDKRLSALRLLRAGGIMLTEGMRSVGDTTTVDTTTLTRITPSQDLLNFIVGVLHPPVEEEDPAQGQGQGQGGRGDVIGADVPSNLLTCNVAGFLRIVAIDIENDSISFLCPCPGNFPSRFLLVGTLKWLE